MADSTEDVLFKIGVFENPANRQRLEAMAAKVLETQKSIAAGAGAVGAAAASAGAEVTSVADSAEQAMDELVESVEGVLPSIRNVFEEMADVAEEHAARMSEALEREMAEVPGSIDSITQQVRESYQRRMVEHSEVYAEMAGDIDGYLAKNGTAGQKIEANMRQASRSLEEYRDAGKEAYQQVDQAAIRGARSTIQMVKGIAELGLMSEANVQKFMQSMAAIQGAFDIFEGGAEMIEAFNNGYRAMIKAKSAAAVLSRTESALNATQFAQLKAYNAALLEEASAANAAAMAESRLAAARGGAGAAAAKGGAGAIVGAAGKAAGGLTAGAGASGAGGAIAGAGAGIATTAAAAGAALAALALVAVEVGEVVSGRADKEKSVTGTIARTEVSIAGWALRLTGAFESSESSAVKFAQSFSETADAVADQIPVIGRLIKSMNLFGDMATYVASQAKLERAERKTAEDKARNDAKWAIQGAEQRAKADKEVAEFKNFADTSRNLAGSVGTFDASMGQESRIMADAQQRLEQQQQIVDDFAAGVSMSDATVEAARKNVDALRKEVNESLERQKAIATAKGNSQLASEKSVEAMAAERLADAQARVNQMADGQVGTEEELNQARQEAAAWQEMIIESQSKQAQIQRQSATEREAAEQKYQDITKATYDKQTAQLRSLDEQRRAAAQNFAKMGDIEKDFAVKALQQARSGGADSLTDEQRDLLRQVGTSESLRFADQADQAEAKKFGFDKTFGTSIEADRASIEAARTQIEANLKSSYDVEVKMEFDVAKIADEVVRQTNSVMDKRHDLLVKEIEHKLKSFKTEQNQARDSKIREMQSNSGRR